MDFELYGNWLLMITVLSTGILGTWIFFLVRLKWQWSMLLSLGINIGLVIYIGCSDPWRRRFNSDQGQVSAVALLIVTNLGVALFVKLYRAAVLDKSTPAERLPGAPGVRAWLSPLNVITVIVVTLAADPPFFGYSYAFTSIMGLCMLLVYPFMNTLLQQPTSATTPPQAPAEERQRVLALVEAGKITAEDGAELLSALAQSQVAGIEASGTISAPRRLLIAGGMVVLVGFFLPWFTINVTQAMQSVMGSMQQSLQQSMPQIQEMPASITFTQPNMTNGNSPQMQNTMQTELRGGDVRNGLGWIMLAAGVCAAGLPFFWIPRDHNAMMQRNVILGALAVGSIAMLYLLSNSFNAFTTIEPGFMLAIAGYVLLWAGGVREYIAGSRSVPMASVATV